MKAIVASKVFTVLVERLDLLDRVPGGKIDDRLTVILYGVISKVKDANIQFVGKERAIGIE